MKVIFSYTAKKTKCREVSFSSNRVRYLFPDEQRDWRNPVCVLVALGYGDLLQELHFLLTGQKNYLGLTKHHYSVGELVAKQPRLPERNNNMMIIDYDY